MIMRVGPFLYRVEFVDDYITHEGQPCLGLCDNDAQVLYVARIGSEAQQIQVLCHEYMEAWMYQFGPDVAEPDNRVTIDKEALCDLCGLAMTQFAVDLMHEVRLAGGDDGGCRPITTLLDARSKSPQAPDAADSGVMPRPRVAHYEHAGDDKSGNSWRVSVFEPAEPFRPADAYHGQG